MAPAAAAFYGDPTASLRTVGSRVRTARRRRRSWSGLCWRQITGRPGCSGPSRASFVARSARFSRPHRRRSILQKTFRAMLDAGDRACVMEVSSHALELRRADAIHFAAAVFTNLTQDHLDFPTMGEYFDAKRLLFTRREPPASAIINIDDAHGARLAAELERPITFGIHGEASYRALDIRIELSGSAFTANTRDGALELKSTSGASSTSQSARGAGRGTMRSAFPRRRVHGRSRLRARCRDASRRSTWASRSPSWSTTPTRPTRWRAS